MNALVLNGSPVRGGATAWITEEIVLQLQARYSVRSVCIDDYRIGFCRGCRACERTARCVSRRSSPPSGAQEKSALSASV